MQFLLRRPDTDLARKQSAFDQLAGERVLEGEHAQLTKARQVTGPTNEDSARRSELVKRALRSTGRSAPWSWGRPGQQRDPARCPQLLDLIKVLAYVRGFLGRDAPTMRQPHSTLPLPAAWPSLTARPRRPCRVGRCGLCELQFE